MKKFKPRNTRITRKQLGWHILCILCILWFVSYAAVSPHPNIMWDFEKAFDSYAIEIATDVEFQNVVDRDTIDNVARYVPAEPLSPGTYYWRTKGHDGSFQVDAPENEMVIQSGSGMKEIRSALAAAETTGSTCIRFEPGEYHLSPGFEGTVFEVHNTTNLIVDGGGAKFVIHDIARLVEMRFSKHITFRNFSVDYECPVYTAAKVESVDVDGTLELSLWPGCVPPETVSRFMEEKRGLFSDPEVPRMAENVPLIVTMKEEWQPLGDGRYRLQAKRKSDVKNVKPGMVYVCAPRYVPQGIELYNSADITFADVTTHYLPGIGVVAAFAEDLKLIRFNILRREDRLLGVQNGGTNIHNARIGPWVEGCRFENTGDDCNHLSSLILTPVEQPERNTVVISPQQPGVRGLPPDMDIQPGDTLAFFQRLEASLLAEATVVSAKRSGQMTTIVLDRDIPKIVCGTGKGNPDLKVTQIYDLSRSCGNFVFRNNAFVRGRRTGILAKSGPGLIEDNRFEDLGGGGVEIFNAPYEGLNGHDILIKDNIFRRGGLVDKGKSMRAPAIWIEMFHWGVVADPLHRNIRIIDNDISDYPAHAMDLCDVTGLTVKGNRIRNVGDEPIRLENVKDANVQKTEDD